MPKFSRKRKFTDRMAVVYAVVTEDAKGKLTRMAGTDSFGLTVEQLIQREYARRAKRMGISLYVQDSALSPEESMQ
jgi:hypothetical protein